MATRTVLREILNAIERDDSNTVLSLINANSGATFQTDVSVFIVCLKYYFFFDNYLHNLTI